MPPPAFTLWFRGRSRQGIFEGNISLNSSVRHTFSTTTSSMKESSESFSSLHVRDRSTVFRASTRINHIGNDDGQTVSKERGPSNEIKEDKEGEKRRRRRRGNSRDQRDYERRRDRAKVIVRGTFLTPDCRDRRIKLKHFRRPVTGDREQ